jgi:hypothetical protein
MPGALGPQEFISGVTTIMAYKRAALSMESPAYEHQPRENRRRRRGSPVH